MGIVEASRNPVGISKYKESSRTSRLSLLLLLLYNIKKAQPHRIEPSTSEAHLQYQIQVLNQLYHEGFIIHMYFMPYIPTKWPLSEKGCQQIPPVGILRKPSAHNPSTSPPLHWHINNIHLCSTPSPPIMPANTHSTKPHNHSGLQQQPTAAEKCKRAESGTEKSNKKLKATTNETTDDVDDDSQVTGKGKRAPRGKGKQARCVAPPAMSLLPTSFRKTTPKCTQDNVSSLHSSTYSYRTPTGLPESYQTGLGLGQISCWLITIQILSPSPSGVLVNSYWNDAKSQGIADS